MEGGKKIWNFKKKIIFEYMMKKLKFFLIMSAKNVDFFPKYKKLTKCFHYFLWYYQGIKESRQKVFGDLTTKRAGGQGGPGTTMQKLHFCNKLIWVSPFVPMRKHVNCNHWSPGSSSKTNIKCLNLAVQLGYRYRGGVGDINNYLWHCY